MPRQCTGWLQGLVTVVLLHLMRWRVQEDTNEELRCVLAVVRHGDRTPKQKLKLNVTQPAFLALFVSAQQGLSFQACMARATWWLCLFEQARGFKHLRHRQLANHALLSKYATPVA